MSKRLPALAAVVALALSAATAAAAGQTVTLKTEVTSGRVVTLGDLFDNAGAAAATLIGYGAPAGQDAVLDAGEVQRIAHIHGLDWDNPSHIRRIVVRSDGTAPGQAVVPQAKMIDALTYSRNLAAGEILQPSDLVYAKIAAFAAPQDMPRDADALIGKMVKRPLRAGTAAAGRDVTTAQVIKRDDLVEVTFQDDGVGLIMQGKAMGTAAIGETVSVLNPASKKVIQAVAVGLDQAVVGPTAEKVRAAALSSPLQFATR